ncbi:MAG TPA: alpha-1,4-glucan--maltose-1-phosphate maltosyltransferase [Acidimicrobiales bacterium]
MASSPAAQRRSLSASDEPHPTAPLSARALPFPSRRSRPVVGGVRPQVDGGRRPAKACVGDLLAVEADAFVDGHEALWCELRYRHAVAGTWSTARMEEIGDDRWRGTIAIGATGLYRFMVRARVDRFATWRRDLRARADAGQDLAVEFLTGAELVEEAVRRARGPERRLLVTLSSGLSSAPHGLEDAVPAPLAQWAGADTLGEVIFSARLGHLIGDLGDPGHYTNSETLSVVSERAKARCSAWYEMFPRSASPDRSRPGTFADVEARLDYVAGMGFDVLYLPPIHPIGRTGRKGRDGSVSAGPGDPGSPWAIGAAEGGHTAIHPDLGTLAEFRALVEAAAARGIDVALDLAFQCSPDHPWVTEHPEWFRHRPDGTIRHAENPPKQYQDIYPLNFDTPDWHALWAELLGVVRYWIAQGVVVFRVDNPHTKPFIFWEWLLGQVRAEHPETIFLSEAFTRPRVMEQLAKVGFTQSYTYFTWRTSKWELETYLTELTRGEMADYFRPNFWPTTPDILPEELQEGGRGAFLARLVLAATMTASYGIYGPAFELQEHVPRSPGSEEYRRSEKYEVRTWDLESPESLSGFIGLVNQIRREHNALQFNDTLTFHPVDNDQIITYSKTRRDTSGDDIVVVVVSLDHAYPQSGWVDLRLDALGVDPGRPYVMVDLLTDARYWWEGARNFVKLDPARVPCHIFSLERPDFSSEGPDAPVTATRPA